MEKKYIINYSFDTVDNKYVAVCNEYVGFIIYCNTMDSLKKNVVKMLKAYTKKDDISADNIEFVEIKQELELGM